MLFTEFPRLNNELITAVRELFFKRDFVVIFCLDIGCVNRFGVDCAVLRVRIRRSFGKL